MDVVMFALLTAWLYRVLLSPPERFRGSRSLVLIVVSWGGIQIVQSSEASSRWPWRLQASSPLVLRLPRPRRNRGPRRPCKMQATCSLGADVPEAL